MIPVVTILYLQLGIAQNPDPELNTGTSSVYANFSPIILALDQ